jgi:hypothetical protein
MACDLGEGRSAWGQPAQTVQDEVDHVALPALELLQGLEAYADSRGDGSGMDQRKPAECDDTEQQLRRVAGFGVVQPELGADGRERFLSGGEVGRPLQLVAPLNASRSMRRMKLGRAARKSK